MNEWPHHQSNPIQGINQLEQQKKKKQNQNAQLCTKKKNTMSSKLQHATHILSIPILPSTTYDTSLSPRMLPTPKPPHQAAKPHCNTQMPGDSPGHSKQVLWAKHSPDEQMLSEHRTREHNSSEHSTRPEGQQRSMCAPLLGRSPRFPGRFLFSRHLVQPLALARNPICNMHFRRVDVALRAAVRA